MNDISKGRVIWSRPVDEARHRKRTQWFVRFYVAPVAVIAVLVAAFSGLGSAAGVVIVGVMFGLLVALATLGRNLMERTNPTMSVDGGDLRVGKQRIQIDRVTSYAAGMTKVSMTQQVGAGVASSSTATGRVRFELDNGKNVEVLWMGMTPDQLDGVRSALEGVFPGRGRTT